MKANKRVKKIYLILIGFISTVMISSSAIGQQSGQEQIQTTEAPAPVPEEPVLIGEARPYTLGNEDVLQVTVRNQPDFSGNFIIGPDSMIQYNFVGDIHAAGLTKYQLKEILKMELERFVKSPEVSITIASYRSKNVFILGEVARPGKYPMQGDSIPLRDAIAIAGLPTREAALRRVYVIKFNAEKATYKKVDLFALLYKGRLKHNLNLIAGDIVVVPSTVPSEINRALNTLLSPLLNAASVDALIYQRMNRGSN
ncbi:MAG: polysaccharide biosynthesis/export family protein [Candidatus Omnitrophota bacterium]